MIFNRQSSNRSARSAFTLIELMVVIGLIMIVMTIGIPRLIYNNETPLGGTLSAVMDACAAARTKAILSGQPTKVVVDSENYSVTVGGASIKPKTELETLNSNTTNFDSLDDEPKPTPQTGTSFSGKIHADVGVDFLAVNFKDMLDEARAEINFYPNGICHGDLTLSNVIIEKKNIYLIDFLKTYHDSILQDLSKVYQEFILGWSSRYLNGNEKLRSEIYYKKIIDQNFFQLFSKKMLNFLNFEVMMTLFRIFPYVQKDDKITINWLLKSVEKVLRNKT